MRTLTALALVLAACDASSGRPEGVAAGGTPAVVAPQTRDQLLLRIPRRAPGPARVFAFPRIDSLIWTAAEPTPAMARPLAFDQEAGTLAFVDLSKVPRFLDLRTGTTPAGSAALEGIASRDAWNVFGITKDGSVVRATPATQGVTPWRFKPPVRATGVYPQSDGSIVVTGDRAKETVAWHLFPPNLAIEDSTTLPHAGQGVPTQVGDRLYLAVDSGLIGVRGRDLRFVEPIGLEQPVVAAVATPSGDRLFVATDSSRIIRIVNIYRDEISGEIELPGQPSALRMDAYGRALIARPAKGDSIWIIDLGSNRLIGSARSTWRADMPVVAPDGSIVVARGRDVALLDGVTLERRRSLEGAADDVWHFFEWGGFRPRAAGIDEPVSFEGIGIPDSVTLGADSTRVDTMLPPIPPLPPGSDSVRLPPPPPTDPPTTPTGFTVSFAALLDERRAEEMAREIQIEGRAARVISSVRDGTPLYRVVIGPYATRAEADRVGRASGRQYWIFESNP